MKKIPPPKIKDIQGFVWNFGILRICKQFNQYIDKFTILFWIFGFSGILEFYKVWKFYSKKYVKKNLGYSQTQIIWIFRILIRYSGYSGFFGSRIWVNCICVKSTHKLFGYSGFFKVWHFRIHIAHRYSGYSGFFGSRIWEIGLV